MDKSKKIGVLLGGLSSEREISIKTGEAFLGALRKKGYTVSPIDVGRNITSVLLNAKIDVAVIALHGKLGEDGTIQGLLECMGIPYTGSGVMASAVAMNKIITKQLAQSVGVSTPPYLLYDVKTETLDTFEKRVHYPVVIKAQAEGSSRGTVIVRDPNELKAAIKEAAQFDTLLIAEDFIEGPQVTIPILNGKLLPAIDIVPKSGFYDYHAKYTKGATEYIIPARVSDKTLQEANDVSQKMYNLLQCRGCARVDFMIDAQGKPWFIELNTLPGMTETSLVPMSAATVGIPFEDLVEDILGDAALDHEKIYRS